MQKGKANDTLAIWERQHLRESAGLFFGSLLINTGKIDRVPNLYRSFSAKELYNSWLLCEK